MIQNIVKFCWTKKYYLLFVLLFGILTHQRFLNVRTNGLTATVSNDGTGYYFYLPATLIYHDLTYACFENPKNKLKDIHKPYLTPYINNQWVNKYYCGTALCLTPFFVTGMVVSAIVGTPMNGYTDTFLMLISIASIVYLLLSIYLLIQIGRFFGATDKFSFLLALVFFFGTNLYHFTIQEPSMSHLYSFFAVSLFFYVLTNVISDLSYKWLLFLGLSLGLITIIRPPNIVVVLFVPFFFESFTVFFQFIKKIIIQKPFGLLLFIIAFLCMLSIQGIFYFVQTGDFFIMAYTGETFDFEDPEIFNILFSYRKGLFVYTPLILVALIFILFAGRDWFKKTILFITLGVFLYIAASWWCWTYGGGFGNRPFIDIYPLVICALMYFYSKSTKLVRFLGLILLFPLIFINQLMAFQYSNRLMNSIGNVSKEDYWDLFFATNMQSINTKKIHRLGIDAPTVDEGIDGFEFALPNEWIVDNGYRSRHSYKIGAKNNFSIGLTIPITKIGSNDSYYVIAECMAKANKKASMAALVIAIMRNNKLTKWEGTIYNQFDTLSDGWAYMSNVQCIDRYEINAQSEIRILACSFDGQCLIDNLRYRIVKETLPQ
ncbi:MAG: hypothetical protein IPN99_00520 [Bacteroidetes bacterium]|nr:hypothetical protein [Bacteroidota bacterium]